MTLERLKGTAPLLMGLDISNVEFLESVATEMEVDTRAMIFDDDEPADRFYLVAAGKVGLEVSMLTGPSMLVSTLGPGELLGVSWLFPPHRWSWRARALAPTSLVAFDAVAVRRRCAADADLALHVYRAVAEEAVNRLHATRVCLLDLYPGGGS